VRAHLLARSLKSNPALDPTLTAYTPGETVELLQNPQILAWHERAVAALPAHYTQIVLVPCAKTKPWVGPASKRSKLYSAYNELRAELPHTCFVTISEPLGIVPMSAWADFPQYDNPGLFRDDAQRSGMTTKEWMTSPFARCYGLPFDKAAHTSAIAQLGAVVGRFLTNNSERDIISVVDNADGSASTHAQMLDVAVAASGARVQRHPKRAVARVSPLPYLRQLLNPS
jgi:hypothetical protein